MSINEELAELRSQLSDLYEDESSIDAEIARLEKLQHKESIKKFYDQWSSNIGKRVYFRYFGDQVTSMIVDKVNIEIPGFYIICKDMIKWSFNDEGDVDTKYRPTGRYRISEPDKVRFFTKEEYDTIVNPLSSLYNK